MCTNITLVAREEIFFMLSCLHEYNPSFLLRSACCVQVVISVESRWWLLLLYDVSLGKMVNIV